VKANYPSDRPSYHYENICWFLLSLSANRCMELQLDVNFYRNSGDQNGNANGIDNSDSTAGNGNGIG